MQARRACARCGAPFTHTKQGRRLYCDACPYEVRRRDNYIGSRARCEECGKQFVKQRHRRYCSQECSQYTSYTCIVCGRTFRGKRHTHKTKHGQKVGHVCGIDCRNARRWGDQLGNDERRRLISKERSSARHMRRVIDNWRTCQSCGLWFSARTKATRYCSHRCGGIGSRPTYGERTCEHCGTEYTAVMELQRYCSKTCGTRAARHTQRARQRTQRSGGLVSRAYVLKRDGYRCHLCGRALDMKATAPHARSPSLDHVVPLALGGEHSHANVRAAHYGCNVVKRTRAMGEQLALFG